MSTTLLLINTKTRQARRVVARTVGPWYEFSANDEQLRANLEYFRAHGDEQAEAAPRSASASAFERIAIDLSISQQSQT